MNMKLALYAGVATAVLLLVFPYQPVVAKNASIGIYAIVDEVTLQPAGDSPEFVRISGIFVIPVPISSGLYQSPRRGYLYFRIAPGSELATRKDWSELKKFAGSDKVVGFGQYWVANPSDPQGNPHHSLEVIVHQQKSDGTAPEVYPSPLPAGVLEVKGPGKDFDRDADKIAAQLRAAAQH